MTASQISGIYAVTPETEDTTELIEKVTAVLNGGARVVQYRNKNGACALQREQCIKLLACVRAFDGSLIVNDSSKLALEVGADGVHLGQVDESVESARTHPADVRLADPVEQQNQQHCGNRRRHPSHVLIPTIDGAR